VEVLSLKQDIDPNHVFMQQIDCQSSDMQIMHADSSRLSYSRSTKIF